MSAPRSQQLEGAVRGLLLQATPPSPLRTRTGDPFLTAELTHICRQAAGSMIVRGAHAVRAGNPPSSALPTRGPGTSS